MTSYGYTLELGEAQRDIVEEALCLLKEKTERELASLRDTNDLDSICGIKSVYANELLAQLAEQKTRLGKPRGQATSKPACYEHINGAFVRAYFSDCGTYRYRLTIDFQDNDGGKCVCVIMQNPSVADAEFADRTVKFLEKLVFLEGYPEFEGVGRMIIVNQFAYVQTNDFDGSGEHIGPENDAYIQKALSEADIVLVAWGRTNKYKERGAVINAFIAESGEKLLLQTDRHPSRGAYKNFIKSYSI